MGDYLVGQIDHYQQNVAPKIKEKYGIPEDETICKHFTPTCSEYAKEAIGKYGAGKGILMAIGRLARCNPFTKGGYDPVK